MRESLYEQVNTPEVRGLFADGATGASKRDRDAKEADAESKASSQHTLLTEEHLNVLDKVRRRVTADALERPVVLYDHERLIGNSEVMHHNHKKSIQSKWFKVVES